MDSEILHGGEGGDVEWWLESRNKFFVFAIAYLLISFSLHCLHCVVVSLAHSIYCLHLCFLVLLRLIHYSYLSVFTYLNKKAIEHLNL